MDILNLTFRCRVVDVTTLQISEKALFGIGRLFPTDHRPADDQPICFQYTSITELHVVARLVAAHLFNYEGEG